LLPIISDPASLRRFWKIRS